jgi:hypothetical protein
MAIFAGKYLIHHSRRLSATAQGRSTHIFVCSAAKDGGGKSATVLKTCLFGGIPPRGALNRPLKAPCLNSVWKLAGRLSRAGHGA